MLASPSADHTIRIWNADSGALYKVFEDRSTRSISVVWSPDGKMLASHSSDRMVRIWSVASGRMIHAIPQGEITHDLAWSPNGQMLVSSASGRLDIWTTDNWTLVEPLSDSQNVASGLSWSLDGSTLAAGCRDHTIRLWNVVKGGAARVINTPSSQILNLAWSPNGRTFACGDSDSTIRLYDAMKERHLVTLEGHRGAVTSVSFSFDGQFLASKSQDRTVRLWRCDTWDTIAELNETSQYSNLWGGLAFHPRGPVLATLAEDDRVIHIWDLDFATLLHSAPSEEVSHYVNAKVVLVGESGVGKSALGMQIAEERFEPTISTHGARFWQIPVPNDLTTHLRAELTLWDLAGQPEYRLVHQLFLDDLDVALLLFDCSDSAEPFRGVHYWAKVLKKQAPSSSLKFLVSARVDVSPVTIGQREINHILDSYHLDRYVRTSAKTGEGVAELRERILKGISWDKLPRTSTPRLFQTTRELLLKCKEEGLAIVSVDRIKQEIRLRQSEQEPDQEAIDAVIRLLQSRGLVYRLEPTPNVALILLSPELINQYASSIVQMARGHSRGIGAVSERAVVCAELDFVGVDRLDPANEKIVLESTVEILIKHDLCFRELGLLVFPSQISITRPATVAGHPPAEVFFEFSGGVETIYASLVVRLSYTEHFMLEDQWRYAVEFSRGGQRLGFNMHQLIEGTGEIEVYFSPGVSALDRVLFVRFITDHLRSRGIDIVERIRLDCPRCGKEVKNRDAIESRLHLGKSDIPCQYCGSEVAIPRSIEDRYRSDLSPSERQPDLAHIVEKRTAQEIEQFRSDHHHYSGEVSAVVHILHIADLHVQIPSQVYKYRTQLDTDLLKELGVRRLEHLVVSGDVSHSSVQEEYLAALDFFDEISKRFGLDPTRITIVPGNHDLDWDSSEDAYLFVSRRRMPNSIPPNMFISAGEAGVLLRDDELYRQRFAAFSSCFFQRIYGGKEYPLDYSEQGMVQFCPTNKILFLALNSAWEIDHHFRHRSSINMEALARALDQLQDGQYDDWLKIAVFHHPIIGREAMNDDFLQLLSVHGFQVCLHGHVHEAKEGFYNYDDKRGIHIIGAGTFGAPTREEVTGAPLQYNLLTFDPATRKLTVETRKKEKPDGAWMADARWGDKNNPSPRYTIQLK